MINGQPQPLSQTALPPKAYTGRNNTSALNSLSLRGSESDRSNLTQNVILSETKNLNRIASPLARNDTYCVCINNCGQSSLEYAIIIICLAAGLFAMQPYLQKAFQGRLRQQADELGQQYDPEKTSGKLTMTNNNTTKTISKTYDETQIGDRNGNLDIDDDGTDDFKNVDCDLNDDGKNGEKDCDDKDVFATFTKSIVVKGEVTQKGNETIRP